ncbi:MAG: beta family protein [Candidatus Omnitrophica bacterium]|nr:beta family protein [Candidatus Omnitrophota bacterium]MBU2035067.1 beta family protein [Candidatus Omnitrophota bacterium]
MFSSKHYVPILKWKRAEQSALKVLEEKHKKHITPLLQFVMSKGKPGDQREDIVVKFEEQLPKIPEKVIEVWGKAPIFIDVSLLYTTPLKAKALVAISQGGHDLGGVFIPIVHLYDEQKIKEVAYSLAKKNKCGLCLRLICPDFVDLNKLNQDIANFLSVGKLEEKDIDLLVDVKEAESNGNKCSKYLGMVQDLPNLTKWRTFSFASGSFPEDLSAYKLDEENLIPRVDWISWKGHVTGKTLKRKPAFADYTIQHPIYKEATQFYHPTTSIKYTLEDEWLIMKGKKHRFEMYLGSAKLLSQDRRFYGESFSYGDKYVALKAKHCDVYLKNKKLGGTGSTETWITAGINHHLVLVANQVSNLS